MGIAYNTSVVRDGLVLYLDAANPKSYPGTGATWFDLSGKNAHAEMINGPTFVSNGSSSHFNFDGVNDKMNSVNISQNYRDLFIVMQPENTGLLSMVFGKFENQDNSLRVLNGILRVPPSVNSNDWHNNSIADVFINGKFNAIGQAEFNLGQNLNFLRLHRSNDFGFGSSFRYEISSDFLNRRYKGKICFILCYDRKLSNSEVTKNFEALRGRYGI